MGKRWNRDDGHPRVSRADVGNAWKFLQMAWCQNTEKFTLLERELFNTYTLFQLTMIIALNIQGMLIKSSNRLTKFIRLYIYTEAVCVLSTDLR